MRFRCWTAYWFPCLRELLSSRTQLITQNSGLQALSSKESAKNQCVINSVQLLNRLIVAIADALVPQLVPKYRVAIEKRIYEIKEEQSLLVGIPDVSIKHNPIPRNSNTSKLFSI